MALQKAIFKKKIFEKEKKNVTKMLLILENYGWKALKSLGMKSGNVNQSKTAFKTDGAIQIEPTKKTNIFKDFYSDIAGNLVIKFPVALNKFNNNSTKQYYINTEKSCRNIEQCNATLETIKKILACLD